MSALHCWKGRNEWIEETFGVGSPEWLAIRAEDDATCFLADGHDGPHEWTPTDRVVVAFPPADGEAGRRYRPFSNGSQFGDWCDCNCGRCVKDAPDDGGPPTCPIQVALGNAYVGDGTVDAETARRMGYLDVEGAEQGRYVWPCTEADWAPWWIEEWKRRHPEEQTNGTEDRP